MVISCISIQDEFKKCNRVAYLTAIDLEQSYCPWIRQNSIFKGLHKKTSLFVTLKSPNFRELIHSARVCWNHNNIWYLDILNLVITLDLTILHCFLLDLCLRFIHTTSKPHIYYMILTTHTNDTHILKVKLISLRLSSKRVIALEIQ